MNLAAKTAERVMVDRVRITRDTAGPTDDVLDPITLQLTPPASDTSIVYEGKGLVHPTTQAGAGDETRGGQTLYQDTYDLRIPATAPAPRVGDTVTVPTSKDPALTAMTFTITKVVGSTVGVTRRCEATVRHRGPAT